MARYITCGVPWITKGGTGKLRHKAPESQSSVEIPRNRRQSQTCVHGSSWMVRTGSRASRRQDASIPEKFIPRSISRSNNTPPSDDSAPPSKRACISCRSTGDRPGRKGVLSFMVGWIFCWKRMILFNHQNHTLFQQLDLCSPTNSSRLMNNSG